LIALGSAKISLYSKGEDTWEFSRDLLGPDVVFLRSKRRTADGYFKEQFSSHKYLSISNYAKERKRKGKDRRTFLLV